MSRATLRHSLLENAIDKHVHGQEVVVSRLNDVSLVGLGVVDDGDQEFVAVHFPNELQLCEQILHINTAPPPPGDWTTYKYHELLAAEDDGLVSWLERSSR